jgi:plasmid maintenance system killer protein
VIQSFKDGRTRAAFEGAFSKGFPADLLAVTRRKLGYLNAATSLSDLRAPLGNRLEALRGDDRGSTRFASTISGGFALCGRRRVRWTWSSSTITSVPMTKEN